MLLWRRRGAGKGFVPSASRAVTYGEVPGGSITNQRGWSCSVTLSDPPAKITAELSTSRCEKEGGGSGGKKAACAFALKETVLSGDTSFLSLIFPSHAEETGGRADRTRKTPRAGTSGVAVT